MTSPADGHCFHKSPATGPRGGESALIGVCSPNARRCGVGMVSPVSALNPASSLPPQGASPRAIRDALTITEDRAEFDREYQRELDRGGAPGGGRGVDADHQEHGRAAHGREPEQEKPSAHSHQSLPPVHGHLNLFCRTRVGEWRGLRVPA